MKKLDNQENYNKTFEGIKTYIERLKNMKYRRDNGI